MPHAIRSPKEVAHKGGENEAMAGSSKKRIEVTAKMSGIFYRRPAPDQPAYVEIGSAVQKKQVLALLETMKVFQKVKSPVAGTVVEIVAENETPLRDGDVMFVIEVG